jgi:hypothetical protein
MDHRIRHTPGAALLLLSAFSLCAAQTPQIAGQSKPECDPRAQAEYEAATGRKPEGCDPGTASTQSSTTPSNESHVTVPEESVRRYDDSARDGDRSGGGDDWWKWLLGGAVAIGGIAAVDQMTNENWVTPQELDATGPRFPELQKVGHYQVQGYAAPGWPFAVDLETEPGTRTWLEVRYQGNKQKQVVDLTLPDGGRRMEVIRLPGAPGSVGIARYSIRSGLPRGRHKPLYRPMKIHGIGAGPNAVGSLYVSVTRFGPEQASGPANVIWAVSAERKFQKSLIEVLRVPTKKKGKYTLVSQGPIELGLRLRANGSWGTVPMKAAVSPGIYEMQVRAWQMGGDGGDWTGAYAPKPVRIP